MKDSKKEEILADSLFGRPFDSNIDLRGLIAFVSIVVILVAVVLGLVVFKLFSWEDLLCGAP